MAVWQEEWEEKGEAILQLAGYSQKGHGDQTKAGALWTGMGLAKTGET